MAVIRLEHVSHTYSSGTPFEMTAISDVNLELRAGERVCLLGHTGSGKSTFVQHLNALLQPTEGCVFLDGEDINRDRFSRRDVKRRVGLVFQYPEYQLFEETVAADIAFGPKNMKVPQAELDQRVREAAAFTGVDESLFDRSPLELSGGQKRRIAIAGVVAMRPEVLILDEPTAGLDPAGSRQIMDNLRNYQAQTGCTLIVVSHDMDAAAQYFDRLIVFDRGSVRMDGRPEEIFGRAEELRETGLAVPKATELADALRKLGVNISESVCTHDQLLQAILQTADSRQDRKGGDGAC